MEAIRENGFAQYSQREGVLFVYVCRAIGDKYVTRSDRDGDRDLNEKEVSLLKSYGFKTIVVPSEFAFNLVEVLLKKASLEEARKIASEIDVKISDDDVPNIKNQFFLMEEHRWYSNVIRKYPKFKISDSPSNYPDGTPW